MKHNRIVFIVSYYEKFPDKKSLYRSWSLTGPQRNTAGQATARIPVQAR